MVKEENICKAVILYIPILSMYGIFTYIYHKNQLNVGKYAIHGSYGYIYICISNLVSNISFFKMMCRVFREALMRALMMATGKLSTSLAYKKALTLVVVTRTKVISLLNISSWSFQPI